MKGYRRLIVLSAALLAAVASPTPTRAGIIIKSANDHIILKNQDTETATCLITELDPLSKVVWDVNGTNPDGSIFKDEEFRKGPGASGFNNLTWSGGAGVPAGLTYEFYIENATPGTIVSFIWTYPNQFKLINPEVVFHAAAPLPPPPGVGVMFAFVRAVPEPSSLTLATLGGVGLLAARRWSGSRRRKAVLAEVEIPAI